MKARGELRSRRPWRWTILAMALGLSLDIGIAHGAKPAFAEINAFRMVDWFGLRRAPELLPLEPGAEALLIMAEEIDLSGRWLRYNVASGGVRRPRQTVIMSRKLWIGDSAAMDLRGLVFEGYNELDGGWLILVTQTLCINETPVQFGGTGAALTVSVEGYPGDSVIERGDSGGLIVVLGELQLSKTVQERLEAESLSILGALEPAPSEPEKLWFDREAFQFLVTRFSESNRGVSALRDHVDGPIEPETLRQLVITAWREEVENSPESLARRFLSLSAPSYTLSSAQQEDFERRQMTIVRDVGEILDIAPFEALVTQWQTAYLGYLYKEISDADSSGNISALKDVLDRFETYRFRPPLEKYAASYHEARDRMERARSFYRPDAVDPGRRLTATLAPNVVRVWVRYGEQTIPGCGFVLGDAGDIVYIMTAGHVIYNSPPGAVVRDIRLSFWSDGPNPSLIAEVFAETVPFRSGRDRPQEDVGVLKAVAPTGWSWRRDVLGDANRLHVDSRVWFMDTSNDRVLPTSATGLVSVPPGSDGSLTTVGLPVFEGNSGCPLVADSGIVAMIVGGTGCEECVQAKDIGRLRTVIEKFWDVPWGLEPYGGR